MGRALPKWRDPIIALHRLRITNGPAEAMNNLAKRVKRVGLGFRSFHNYRVRTLINPESPTGHCFRRWARWAEPTTGISSSHLSVGQFGFAHRHRRTCHSKITVRPKACWSPISRKGRPVGFAVVAQFEQVTSSSSVSITAQKDKCWLSTPSRVSMISVGS